MQQQSSVLFYMASNVSLVTPDRPQTARLGTTHVPAALLAIFCALWLALAIAPVSRSDWLLENLLILICVPLLVATHRRLRFSNAAYLCFFGLFSLHVVGAHYTYSLVPYDAWLHAVTGRTLTDALGLTRNHFDRLVHLAYGALILLPSVELAEHYGPLRSIWRWLIPMFFVIGHSALYEVIEWLAALIVAPDLGAAYLGTQGDAWDAQKDMALAILGSILAGVFLFARAARRVPT